MFRLESLPHPPRLQHEESSHECPESTLLRTRSRDDTAADRVKDLSNYEPCLKRRPVGALSGGVCVTVTACPPIVMVLLRDGGAARAETE